jgi:hypothetical protein
MILKYFQLASNEIIRFGWSQNKGTVCLKCPPPYLHKFNLFVLDLTRLEWQHLDIDEAVSLSRFYRHLVYGVEIYVDGEDTIVVYGTHRIIKGMYLQFIAKNRLFKTLNGTKFAVFIEFI